MTTTTRKIETLTTWTCAAAELVGGYLREGGAALLALVLVWGGNE